MRIATTLLCLFSIAGASVRATSLLPATVDELAREAGAIVRGRVVSIEPRWTADRRAIETLVTVQAEEFLKGSLGASVRFLVPGGTLGRYRSLFVGAPEFAAGQDVIVFLGWRGPSYPFLLGLSQGVFRIHTDRVNGLTPLDEFERRIRAVREEK